eukprot:g2513.t1
MEISGNIEDEPQSQQHVVEVGIRGMYDSSKRSDPREHWSFADTSEHALYRKMVEDDCSAGSYFEMCKDVRETMQDMSKSVNDLMNWKEQIIGIVDLPVNILTSLMVITSKSRLRYLLCDLDVIGLTESLVKGVVREEEINRLKRLAARSKSQFHLQELRVVEVERKFRAALAQIISLRSQSRVFRWYSIRKKMIARNKKRINSRKLKMLREHTLTQKKMISQATTKIHKLQDEILDMKDKEEKQRNLLSLEALASGSNKDRRATSKRSVKVRVYSESDMSRIRNEHKMEINFLRTEYEKKLQDLRRTIQNLKETHYRQSQPDPSAVQQQKQQHGTVPQNSEIQSDNRVQSANGSVRSRRPSSSSIHHRPQTTSIFSQQKRPSNFSRKQQFMDQLDDEQQGWVKHVPPQQKMEETLRATRRLSTPAADNHAYRRASQAIMKMMEEKNQSREREYHEQLAIDQLGEVCYALSRGAGEWEDFDADEMIFILLTSMASVIAGSCGRLSCHPLDTCKAVIQVNQTPSTQTQANASAAKFLRLSSLPSTFQHIFQREGVAGLYRGFPITIVGSVPALWLYLYVYEQAKNGIDNLFIPSSSSLSNNSRTTKPSFTGPFIAGLIAESVSCVFWVPIDVVKERMQIQGIAGRQTYYRNSWHALTTIGQKEGLTGLYKGYFATIASFGPYSALYFAFYEQLKDLADTKTNPSLVKGIASSSVAAGAAAFLTCPLDLVKLRMQVQRQTEVQ